ncbi:MAG: WhiB family transcriptional regulator, partial [Actinobacteria bacterium]
DEEAEALSICATCPVRAQCLDYAIRNRETYGIWGGTTPDQRRRIRREHAA